MAKVCPKVVLRSGDRALIQEPGKTLKRWVPVEELERMLVACGESKQVSTEGRPVRRSLFEQPASRPARGRPARREAEKPEDPALQWQELVKISDELDVPSPPETQPEAIPGPGIRELASDTKFYLLEYQLTPRKTGREQTPAEKEFQKDALLASARVKVRKGIVIDAQGPADLMAFARGKKYRDVQAWVKARQGTDLDITEEARQRAERRITLQERATSAQEQRQAGAQSEQAVEAEKRRAAAKGRPTRKIVVEDIVAPAPKKEREPVSREELEKIWLAQRVDLVQEAQTAGKDHPFLIDRPSKAGSFEFDNAEVKREIDKGEQFVPRKCETHAKCWESKDPAGRKWRQENLKCSGGVCRKKNGAIHYTKMNVISNEVVGNWLWLTRPANLIRRGERPGWNFRWKDNIGPYVAPPKLEPFEPAASAAQQRLKTPEEIHVALIGHNAEQMVDFVGTLPAYKTIVVARTAAGKAAAKAAKDKGIDVEWVREGEEWKRAQHTLYFDDKSKEGAKLLRETKTWITSYNFKKTRKEPAKKIGIWNPTDPTPEQARARRRETWPDADKPVMGD